MLQSSITAWLQKPASVKKDNVPVEFRPKEPERESDAVPVATPKKIDPSQPHGPPESDNGASNNAHLTQVFALQPLPANVELVPLTEELMPSFKRLTSLTLPIAYPAAFFSETMIEPYHSITLMAVWHPSPENDLSSKTGKPRLVGAIRCRLLPGSNLYISTLGLLPPYRSHGIATHLLNTTAIKASEEHGVKFITAHVWEANEEGLEWYQKRGFETIGKEEGYYRKLKPSGAVLVRKPIRIEDLLGNADINLVK